MIKLIDILNEIQVNNPHINTVQIIKLWETIFNKIDEFWDDNNQDIMLNLDKEFGKINKKYFEKYEVDVIDNIDEESINLLNQQEKNQFYNDLKQFNDKLNNVVI